jgi:uncharacterized membrane protein
MWESLLPFFQWHDGCWLGEQISGSIWLFPFIETIHILAMAIMFGGLLMLNLKMLGLTMPRQSLPLLSKTLMPFVNWGVVIMLISGYGMFASGPMKYYANDGFKVKMAALLLTLIFQYTLYKGFLKKEDGQRSAGMGAIMALLNYYGWFMIGAAGRAIGFV